MQTSKRFACTTCRRRKMRCDGARPSCMTCSRLRHRCEYLELERRGPQKRRNMKDIENRLVEVEGLLASQYAEASSPTAPAPPATDPTQSPMIDVDKERTLSSMDMPGSNSTLNNNAEGASLPVNIRSRERYFPCFNSSSSSGQEVISLGLEEPLPPQDVIDELHEIYFDRIHTALPILHKSRYLSSMKLPSHKCPAICLRYVVWALAASTSGKYAQNEVTFYKRARKYVQADEMKDIGQSLLTLDHARFWVLMGNYESRKMYFHRSWSSSGRAIRLCQMIGLHRLDKYHDLVAGNLSSKEWIDLEEKRRIFWTAFCSDRYCGAVSGWPMIINEKDILTNLPSSSEAFDNGEIEATASLSSIIDTDIISNISSYAGIVLIAALFGRLVTHLHQPNPDNCPQNLAHGEFWKRHRKMDSVFSNILMFLPDHLRISSRVKDCNVYFLHLSMHALTISLHQAAVAKAEMYELDPSVVRQSQARSDSAAEEMLCILRLTTLANIQRMRPFVTFCLHLTVGTFIKSGKDTMRENQSRRNMEILLSILRAFEQPDPVLQSLITQIKNSLQGIAVSQPLSPIQTSGKKHHGMSDFNTDMQRPQGFEGGRSSPRLDSQIMPEKPMSVAISNAKPSSTTDTGQVSCYTSSIALSEVSGQPDQHSSTIHVTSQTETETFPAGKCSGIFQGQFMDDSGYLPYSESEFASLKQTKDITSYDIPHRNNSQNTPSSTEFNAIDALNLQTNANTDPTMNISQFVDFPSSGTVTRYETFDELFFWE